MNYIPDKDLVQEGVIMQISAGGEVETNVPWRVIHHSPDGFSWGYAGSGPADFALNIMEAALTRLGYEGPMMKYNDSYIIFSITARYHQAFKDHFLVSLPQEGGNIPWLVVAKWLMEKIDHAEAQAAEKGGRFLASEFKQ